MEPFIEDWWEGGAPSEGPVSVAGTFSYRGGLAAELYRTWWENDWLHRLMRIYGP